MFLLSISCGTDDQMLTFRHVKTKSRDAAQLINLYRKKKTKTQQLEKSV